MHFSPTAWFGGLRFSRAYSNGRLPNSMRAGGPGVGREGRGGRGVAGGWGVEEGWLEGEAY